VGDIATVQPTILDPKRLWGPTLLTTASVTQYTAPAAEAGVQIDGIVLTNIGLIDFAKVWHLDATTYVDETTDASDVGATDVSIFQTDSDSDGGGAGAADRFYVGSATKFSHISFILGTLGTGSPVLLAAYWNGSAWTDLTLATNSYVDGTNNLKQSGELSFVAPSDWATKDVNGSTQYYIELRTTAVYTIVPVGTQVRQGTRTNPLVTIHHILAAGSASNANLLASEMPVASIQGAPIPVPLGDTFVIDTSEIISAKSNTENQVLIRGFGSELKD